MGVPILCLWVISGLRVTRANSCLFGPGPEHRDQKETFEVT